MELLLILKIFLNWLLGILKQMLASFILEKYFPFDKNKLNLYVKDFKIYILKKGNNLNLEIEIANFDHYYFPINYLECKLNLNDVFIKTIEYKKIINTKEYDKTNIQLSTKFNNEEMELFKNNLRKFINNFSFDISMNIKILNKEKTIAFDSVNSNPIIAMDLDSMYKEFGLC